MRSKGATKGLIVFALSLPTGFFSGYAVEAGD